MKKWLVFALCFLAGSAQAQMSGGSMFPGPGVKAYSGGASYTGPGDLSLSGTVIAWWGFRCYSAAYSGNVADIVDSATGNTTGTRLQCSGGTVVELVSGSACTFVTGNACSTVATTCATACKVVTIYDQSGQTNCGGAACDLTQVTNANRPTFVSSCQNSRPCLTTVAGSSQTLEKSPGVTLAQPFLISYVAKRTGNFTVYSDIVASNNGPQAGFDTAPNGAFIFVGGSLPIATATDNVMHAVQNTFNNTTSEIYVDGSGTSANLGSTTGLGFTIGVPSTVGTANFFTGNWMEVGIWSGVPSSGDKSSLNSNQRSASFGWNF